MALTTSIPSGGSYFGSVKTATLMAVDKVPALPVAVVGGSSPWWSVVLEGVSVFVQGVTPLLAMLLLLLKVYREYTQPFAATKVLSAVPSATPASRVNPFERIFGFFSKLFAPRNVAPRDLPPPVNERVSKPMDVVKRALPVGAPWYDLAQQYLGLREGPGKKNNPKVVAFYKACGFGGITQDSVPWCAAFVGAMLEKSGYASAKSLTARDYLRWGKEITKPRKGCVVVFKRGNSSWQGHVAFFVRETKTHIYVLGGNQSNAVNVARYPRSKLLGYRVPVTMLNSRTVRAGLVGQPLGLAMMSFADPMADAVEPMIGIGQEIKLLGQLNSTFFYIGVGIVVLSTLAGVYFRWDDNRKKGR